MLIPLSECSRNPSVSVYQLALLWEAVFGFSEFFFEDFFQHICFAYFMMVIYKCTCPHCAQFSAIFYPKWHDIPPPPFAPLSLFSSLTPSNSFFVVLDEKSLQRATFYWCGRGETKNGRGTKTHQNGQIQNLSSAVEKSLDRCIASNGGYFEGDWSLNM